jgi:hypothetical protein
MITWSSLVTMFMVFEKHILLAAVRNEHAACPLSQQGNGNDQYHDHYHDHFHYSIIAVVAIRAIPL